MISTIYGLGVPASILDTDLYKLTMQQAVLQKFPNAPATYRFTLRDKSVSFSRHCVDAFRDAVSRFSSLFLTSEEHQWLQKTCPHFTFEYLDYLRAYRFKPEQVLVTFLPNSDDDDAGSLEIDVSGPWVETILWEVPLMACLSEIYFSSVDTDWNYDTQDERSYSKAKTLIEAGCKVMEFGTRRRRTHITQDIVIGAMVRASNDFPGPGKLLGTSNVYFAHKYGLTPLGTVAHEWFMGIAVLHGYDTVNAVALDLWESVYPKSILLALPDTFTSEVFYQQAFFPCPHRAQIWHGLRQDSGDPFAFALRAKEVYESLGIDHRGKRIVHSDSLNVDMCVKLAQHSQSLGFDTSFGIGTFLTNDFHSASDPSLKSKALNMVVKLSSINGTQCVKISDDLTKNTGDLETVQRVKEFFKLG